MRIAVGLVVILGILLALAILDDVGQSELEPGARIVSSTSRIERSFGGTVYSVFFNETGGPGLYLERSCNAGGHRWRPLRP